MNIAISRLSMTGLLLWLTGCPWVTDEELAARADRDGDGHRAQQFGGEDCDDRDPARHPDQIERCNDVDDDCNGVVDDVQAPEGGQWWLDQDGDGHGDGAQAVRACSQPAGTVDNSGDCDDGSTDVHPGRAEICNDGVDDDCDGLADADDPELVPLEAYVDGDGDGYGDEDQPVSLPTCALPEGYSQDSTDCDDEDSAVHPGAEEVCDGLVDEDCDGDLDDADSDLTEPIWYLDSDSDGHGDADQALVACEQPFGHVADDTDCDDTNPFIRPGANETCDGVDQNCNGFVDDSAVDMPTWYADTDEDGYGDRQSTTLDCDLPDGFVADSTDCDDSRDDIHPGATESCSATEDLNCDGQQGGEDNDGDSWRGCDGDCDDTNELINPDASEVCNGIDDDCDGDVDDDDSSVDTSDMVLVYDDVDGDSFGDADDPGTWTCSAPAATSADNLDCDDGDVEVHPDRYERCNDSVDQDCSGDMDDCSLDLSTADGVATGVSAGDQAGAVLAGVGDLDGDGHADLAIGAPGRNADKGSVYLLAGPATGSTSLTGSVPQWSGRSTGDRAAASLAGIGDHTGDGYDDLAVGAPEGDEAYALFGPVTASGGLVSADVVVVSTDAGTGFGTAVTGGNLDGDATADLVITAPGTDELITNDHGSVYVFYGASTAAGSYTESDDAMTLVGSTPGMALGRIASTGDVDADPSTEEVILAGYGGTLATTETLWIFDLSTATDGSEALATCELSAQTDGDGAGAAISAGGDFDDDGYPDLLVGAPDASTGGRAYLILGPVTTDLGLGSADTIFSGSTAGDQAGSAVQFLGDVDGDGVDDLAIGAPGGDEVALFFGGTALSGTLALSAADMRMAGVSGGDDAGGALAGPGDVDGDGDADLLVGAPGRSSDAGAAYLLLSGPF